MSQRFEPTALVVPFEQLRMSDVESVGGKNASLGEMISQLPDGVRVTLTDAGRALKLQARAVPQAMRCLMLGGDGRGPDDELRQLRASLHQLRQRMAASGAESV